MLAVGNAKVLALPTSLGGSRRAVGVGVAVSGLSLLYARRVGLTSAELGLTGWRARAPRSVALALGTGLGLTLVAALLARAVAALGLQIPLPAAPGDLLSLRDAALRRRLLAYLPLDTAVPEEIVFRGVITAELTRRAGGSPWRTIVGTAVCFELWHLALGLREASGLDRGQLVEKLGAYALGSVVFTLPRLLTGQLVGSMLLHWLADALLMVAGHPSGERFRALLLGPKANRTA
ncbi:MAG: CPBP family intramembrane metalloprotease [Chloroflexi bacterium]|nr:CPBP family intramembrane metalloprotease [Chloroflexota bacterium]